MTEPPPGCSACASPDVWSVGSQASWRQMGSQDGTAQGVAAKLEQHSHFGELRYAHSHLHRCYQATWPKVWAYVVYLWFWVEALRKPKFTLSFARFLHAG